MLNKRIVPVLCAVVCVAAALAAPLMGVAQPVAGGAAPAPAGAAPGRAGGAGAPGRGAAAAAKPGYVQPPENSGGLYPVSGEQPFKDHCAMCHDPAVDRAPPLANLALRSPEDVYDALTSGVMKGNAEGLTEAQIYGIVRFITGKAPTPNKVMAADPNPCPTNPPIRTAAPAAQWNGWGHDVTNNRYQPTPGIAAADVPKLKVKWAFAYPGTKNTETLIWNDRIFAGSMGGHLYSLDAKTGCVHWRFDFPGGTRASLTLGALSTAPSKYAIYLSDDRMNVHALDAQSGHELWKVKVDDHKVGRITGTPTLYNNVLYVPLSFSEESQGNTASYGCCTGIGTVVAVDAKDGHTIWKSTIIDEKPQPTRRNMAGTQMYGPAGGAIWDSPTVDAKRNLVYVATGDSYTEIEHKAADSVVAFDLKTGARKWVTQVQKGDNFVSGTLNGPLGVRGPDYDFGSSPMLVKLASGKEVLITGNKSSIVYAMDPDTGAIVWKTDKLGIGGASGGEVWGTSTDGTRVFVPLNDGAGRGGKPGLVALNANDGSELWRYNAMPGASCSAASGRCGLGFSQSTTAIPGIVFAGSLDGHLRAFQADDGKLIWDTDTAEARDTVNGMKNVSGGGLDVGGPTLANGMMFIHSGYDGSAGENNVLLAYTVDGK